MYKHGIKFGIRLQFVYLDIFHSHIQKILNTY